ncbi:ATP-binding cassette domain-containing protein [Tissierella pigra]|uniref:ATP-binding cassette domain-containing protein n=1 Tax=Tissierella pigra TaxID=2607614 RepID=A0A6N7XTH7_9FIRM|nr:ATP-binding cassette domain-containing protein [Tissierella pigra]MBU5425923.1 ATP-binding cassette domain-containing protein [Tissierella pigra]MSU00713.1 ATP-binding cassette domain-containing protein [Tissierella pigra]
MEVYRIKDLNFTYPLMDKKALNNINLIINKGEFLTICGKSGSGKSTLIRQLKTILSPHGKKEGEVYFSGQPLPKVEHRIQASQIGYVFQNPDNQIVTDKVWHELAFGLESLGYDNKTIRIRVAEMASFFGIHNWFHNKVTELSGGQKQILNLAGIMTMQPSVLILDEPTSQLDPIAASEFIETIKKINQELGTTIIMTEHRLEEIIPISDRVIVMDEGSIISEGTPEEVGKDLHRNNHPMVHSMTSAMQIYAGVRNQLPYPITVNEGRRWIDSFMEGKDIKINSVESIREKRDVIIKLKDIWFKYDKSLPDTIKDMSLEVEKGEIYCILGGNGTGKTTALSIISGILTPYRGKVFIGNKNLAKMSTREKFINNLGVLPQNPQHLFVKKTLELDLYEMLSELKIPKEEKSQKIKEVVELTELENLLNRHPYDLSGGEQQRGALSKVLLLEPKILLLDEPTKGLDNFFKEKLAKILKTLSNKDVTTVMVSHDIEFCAKHGDTCAMVFDGNIVSSKPTKEFFAGNSFYTTSANRISRHICSKAVTIEDVIRLCQENI